MAAFATAAALPLRRARPTLSHGALPPPAPARPSRAPVMVLGGLARLGRARRDGFEVQLPGADVGCACGSGREYGRCCRALHTQARSAGEADELLRARYSAYAYRLPAFIMRTTAGEAQEFDRIRWRSEIAQFCDQYQFVGGLEIIEQNMTGPATTTIVFRYVRTARALAFAHAD